ncbi:MAG: hypothetical protein OXE77_06210 [Flavobacteriaceae bacterium]|nr:hypothetical protein [Flavobacteriaceae bacterium]MCY4267371.1 hypothetical protein [Flavobacteriaceae bacterium]MCY4299573.1 hypothetical protein [Flavobacteriaceae bacterium]
MEDLLFTIDIMDSLNEVKNTGKIKSTSHVIHSFVDDTIYRLAKVDKEIKSLVEDYPNFKGTIY